MPFPIGDPLILSLYLQLFQDICIQIYLGHDLDLSGSRDVTRHVTSDVQNNIFTGFLDPENVGLAVGIVFLSALDPNLQAITFNTAAILEFNMADTGSSN